MKTGKKLALFISLLFAVLVPLSYSLAADSWTKIYPECIRKQMEATGPWTPDPACDDVGVFIELAINIGAYLFTFIGALALLVFVYGGFKMIISAGDSAKIKEGKDAMVAAVIGIVIAFSGVAGVRFLGETLHLKNVYRLNELPLGACVLTEKDASGKVPEPLNNVTELVCKEKNGTWTENKPTPSK